MFLDCSPVVLGIPVKICPKCGEAKALENFHRDKRRSDGRFPYCKACMSVHTRAWYEKNEDRAKAKAHTWRGANPERATENGRRWRNANASRIATYKDANREHRAQINKSWKKAHPDYHRKRYWANPERARERSREWSKSHPEVGRAHQHRRRARKAGVGGTYTIADLVAIRAAQTDKSGRLLCWHCGKPIKGKPHLDHWIPIDKGGPNDAGNLHYMHARCNLTKAAKHPTEIGRLL